MAAKQIAELEARLERERRLAWSGVVALRKRVRRRLSSPAALLGAFGGGLAAGWVCRGPQIGAHAAESSGASTGVPVRWIPWRWLARRLWQWLIRPGPRAGERPGEDSPAASAPRTADPGPAVGSPSPQ